MSLIALPPRYRDVRLVNPLNGSSFSTWLPERSMYWRPLRLASGPMSLIALPDRSSECRFVRSLSALMSLILFLSSLSQRQVLALLQAREVLDVLAGRFQEIDILEFLIGQLDLGLVLEHVADRGLEVLVGERRGGAGRAGPGGDQAQDGGQRSRSGGFVNSSHRGDSPNEGQWGGSRPARVWPALATERL